MSRGPLHNDDQTRKDSLVIVSCDSEIPLEDRINLLSYQFAKEVSASELRRIVHWNVCDGTIAFIVGGGPNPHVPHGETVVEVRTPVAA